jgi:anti-sigma regulatory factor (Ser/Thr protein kinase)
VRRFFKKVFQRSPESKQYSQPPPLASGLTLHDVKQRAVIGYLARHMAQRLNYADADELFYLAFSRLTFENERMSVVGRELPIHLAGLLYSWVQNKEEIAERMKELNLSLDLESCLIETYEEFKEQLKSEMPAFVPLSNEEEVVVKKIEPKEGEVEELTELTEWKIYRDVMYAVTQKKFLLISKDEIPQYMKGRILCEGEIKERSDIPKCRNLAQKALQELSLNGVNVMGWILLISEAITNILKHAEEGRMLLVEDSGAIRVIVEDKGPGFSLKDLPNMTLMAGYSTKKSLGQGFTLMMKMAKQVLLYTSPKGSTIVLILNKKEDES